MSARGRDWAKRSKAALLEELGGKCVECGMSDKLEFDCIIPCGHDHHKGSTQQRICFYRRQHYQFKNIQILCSLHNRIKANADQNHHRGFELVAAEPF